MESIKLDEEKIQQMAEKYAIEGAEKAIKDYYTSYNSPYVKAVEEHLKKQLPSRFFDLPDFTAAINEALEAKIDGMCDRIVAQTYIRVFNEMLTGKEKGYEYSNDMYRHYCEYVKDREGDDFEPDMLGIEEENSHYGFKYLRFIYNVETEFRLDLYESGKGEDGVQMYEITKLPHTGQYAHLDGKLPNMSIKLDDTHTAAVPITHDVLSNEFMAYIAKLLINGTKIIVSSHHYWEDGDE